MAKPEPALNRLNNNPPITGIRRWVIFIIGVVEAFTYGCCILGWAQLVYVLKKEGIFHDLCRSSEDIDKADSPVQLNRTDYDSFPGCVEQDKSFALVYTISVVLFGTPGVIFGLILHHFGLAVSRIMASLFITTGFLSLSFTTTDTPNFIYLSMISLAVGGNQIRMSGMQFCNLFPEFTSTAMNIISGCFAASAGVFMVFQIGQEYGISLFTMGICFAAFSFLSLPATLIMPWHHIPYQQPHKASSKGETVIKRGRKREGIPLRKSICSISFFTHLFWIFFNASVFSFYSVVFNSWVTEIAPEDVGYYSLLYSLSSFACSLVTPLPGLLTDYLIKRGLKEGTPSDYYERQLRGPVIPLILIVTLSLFVITCLFFRSVPFIYLSMIAMTLLRPSAVGVGLDFLRIRFPEDHFYRILGIISTTTSILSIIQYPLFVWAKKNNFSAMLFFICVLVVSLVHPLHILSKRYRQRILKQIFENSFEEENDLVARS